MTEGPILVTGAGGFVCSEIAVSLARAGRDVVAVDQFFDVATTARLDAVRRIEGPFDALLPELANLSLSAVIHGAAITASPECLRISKAAHIRRNMELLTGALDVAQRAGATRFLFLSSMGVFDPLDGPTQAGRFTEATHPSASCTYAAAKTAGELLTSAAAEPGFTTLSLRLGNIFGAHEAVRETRQHLCLVQRMLAETRASGVIAVQTPEANREWSWLPDLADSIAKLMEQFPVSGPDVLHAGTPPAQTDLAVARAIADRVRGTLIRFAPPPHPPIRPPMGSDHPSVFQTTNWSSMDFALDQLIPAKVTS